MAAIILELIREVYGEGRYKVFATASPHTLYTEGLLLGLITQEEFNDAKVKHRTAWNYCGH